VVPQVVPLVVLEAQVQVLELQDEHVFRWTQRVALEVQAQAKLSEFVLLPHKNLHGLGLQAHRTLQEQQLAPQAQKKLQGI